MHGIAGPFGQGGLVGGLDTGVPERHRRGEHLAAKPLWRLREEDRFAIQGLLDDVVPDALHRVGDLNRRDRGTVGRGGIDRPVDQPGGHERPRRVVDQYHLAVAAAASNAFETESWRRAPPATRRNVLAAP